MRAALSRSYPRRARVLFENILICGSPRQDAPILLRQAMPILAGGVTVRLLELPEAPRQLRSAAPEPIERVLDVLGRRGVVLRRETAARASGDYIIEEVKRGGHDLVVKGVGLREHGRRALDRLDLDLIRRCPCPVWAVECNEPRPLQRILAAIDPGSCEDDDQPRQQLAVRITKHAAALAEASGAELHVLHVWNAFGDHLLRPRMPEEDVLAYVEHARELAQRALERTLTLAEVRPSPGGLHLVKGHFQPAVQRLLADRAIDLVVMGTRGRKGWLDAVVRPHAETVLANTRASALVFKQGE
jgi:nucleotide-binding universal stress UspA family protein